MPYYAMLLKGTSNPRKIEFNALYDLSANNAYLYYSSSTLATNSGWHHVVVIDDGTTIAFYIDGALDSQSNVGSPLIGFSDAVLTIGHSDNGSDFFNGSIAEVRVYNRALSDSEVQQLYMSNSAQQSGESYP